MDPFKKAEVRPQYKKNRRIEKSIYRLVSVNFQMFQKFVKDACIIKFIVILMKHFQGGNMVFVIVLAMIEKKKISRDNKQLCAAILTYLSKAFACVPCNLLNAKFNANGFNQEALKLIHSYLSDRSQKVN